MIKPTITPVRALLIGVALLTGVASILFVAFVASFYATMTSTVMEKHSPNKKHAAELVRRGGIDVNYVLKVDGREVFRSPDFSPKQTDFREQIAWDKSGTIVVLIVAEKRIFGYHIVEKRPLTDLELHRVEFTSFRELRYEGRLPKED